jgi:hypothetical protein
MRSALRPSLAPLGACLALIAAISIQSGASASGFDVYLSAPASQTTIFTDTLTETFSGFTTGVYTNNLVANIGTYQLDATSRLAVVANNQYGTGTGNYVALGAQSSSSAPVTLQLSGSHSYFGFSWNAGDANNELFFYDGSELVGYYSTANVTGLLKNATVTALNGATYQSSDYYGQPGTHLNSNEPYAFINFIDQGGKFDKIVFGNSHTTGTGFESDNHTIRIAAPGPDTSFVFVGSAVPEPGNVALLIGIGLSGTAFVKRRKKAGR